MNSFSLDIKKFLLFCVMVLTSIPAIARADTNCPIPKNLTRILLDINRSPYKGPILSVYPSLRSLVDIPKNQPTECANYNGKRKEPNLKKFCPWIYTEIEMEPDVYPRYLLGVKCLCVSCIGQTANRCQEVMEKVTVMRHTGCRNNQAVMEPKIVHVTVDCKCVRAGKQNAPETGDNGPPLAH